MTSFGSSEGIFRIVFDGRRSIPAKLDDYAFLIQALIAADTLAPDYQFIEHAKRLGKIMMDIAHQEAFIGMTSDTQLSSIAGSAAEALKQLYLVTGNKEYKESLLSFTAKSIALHGDVNQLSLVRGLKVSEGDFLAPVFFGNGHGVAYFQRDNEQLFLVLSLENGWHINSNRPLDDKLVPTQVEFLNSRARNHISAFEFPLATEKRVSFTDKALMLYEQDIKIRVNASSEYPRILGIQLQVCSDFLCLLPERFFLTLPTLNLKVS